MQATSKHQQHQERSPRKETSAQIVAGPGNNNNNNNKSVDSVAQLVMSMNNNSTTNFNPNSNSNNETNSASAVSIESDKEVEEITNRASKVDLNAATSKQQLNYNDQNNNNKNNTNGHRLAAETSSSVVDGSSQQQQLIGNPALRNSVALTMPNLVSSEPVSRQQQTILSPSKLNLQQDKQRRLQGHQSSSRESVVGKSSDAEIPTITLDTKIPHPTASEVTSATTTTDNNNNKDQFNPALLFSGIGLGGGGNSSCSNSIEEVSYYNDQSNLASLDVKQANNNNNSTGPIAATSNPIGPSAAATNSGSCSASSSGSCHNNNNSIQQPITVGASGSSIAASKGTRAKPLAGKEQKLSIIVPPNMSMPGSLSTTGTAANNNKNSSSNNNHNKYISNNRDATALDVCSREYCNDFDDFDSHYDTAAADDSMEGAANERGLDSSGDNVFEMPSSPKAKSAPATPCNVTPTAFHQHNSNNKSNLPNPANTLPVDTRRNISATCRMLPSSISLASASATANQMSHNNFTTAAATTTTTTTTTVGTINADSQLASAVSDQDLDKLIEKGETLFRHENYDGAIRNFSQCIELATRNSHLDYLKKNFRVYSQRAEAFLKLGKYNQAIEDSMAARELNPKWAQAHYILGKAQFHLGKHVDSLTAFSFGLGQVPTSKLLFEALVSAALNGSSSPPPPAAAAALASQMSSSSASPLYPSKLDFVENYQKLRERDLDKDPFVVVATLGQELLSKHHHEHAAIVLESALKLGTDNKRFKSSVLSTTGHVFCAIGDFNKALAYMERELAIETELNDIVGQCRVLSNIGYNYYKMGKFVKSLEAHREQLNLAIRNELHQQTAQAFNAIGHIHVARSDFADALTSHQWCLETLRRLGENEFHQFRELLAIGHVNALLADYKTSEEKYKEAMQMLKSSTGLKKEERQVASIMVYFNLAYLALKRQSPMEAAQHYELVIRIARDMEGSSHKRLLYELRALNGLGHTCRVLQRFNKAREYFAKQLDLAKKVNDLSSQSQALCNLGMIYQHFKDYITAGKLFDENMQLVEEDPLLKAYAHSYRGSMHFLWGEYTRAHEEYEKSLNLFKKFENCSAERKTIELNMDAVNERLGRSQISLVSNTAGPQRKFIMA